MTCPECEQPMVSGFAELCSPVSNTLFQRPSPVNLTFAASETFEYELLKPSERRVAFECNECGTMVLTVEPWLP